MDNEQFQYLNALFTEAVTLEAESRAEFIHELEIREPEIAAELISLLAADDGETLAFASPPGITDDSIELQPGDQLGVYTIVELIGSGGMGHVYLAQQKEPIERNVALKSIRAGMHTDKVLQRFDLERQSMALMSHPNIATIIDAGADQTGHPFFVMEYVDGVSIDEYCRQQNLGLEARLGLFLSVCEAVQHAHQKGIIHRDLKPSNILVHKETQSVKVIDFGVAKSLEQGLDVEQTRADQSVGTPLYMAPEQFVGGTAAADTQTDVYALGVVLYQLLTTHTPFDLAGLSLRQAEDVLRHEMPARPSTRADNLPYDAKHLKGDLDWIIAKAMAQEKELRYVSPADLAQDLRRYLENLPVSASPPGVLYQTKKFMARHRLGTSVALVALLTLLLGAAGTTVGLLRALEAETIAAQEAESANQTIAFIEEIFAAADPAQARGETITAKEVLDQGVLRIDSNKQLSQSARASLLYTMAEVYAGLSLHNESLDLYRRSVAAYESIPNKSATERFRYLDAQKGVVGRLLLLGPIGEAETVLAAVAAEEQEIYDTLSPAMLATYRFQVATLSALDRNSEAKKLFRTTLQAAEEQQADRRQLAFLLDAAAPIYSAEGDHEEAIAIQRQAVNLFEAELGASHPTTLIAKSNLGLILSTGRHHLEAERAYLDILDTYREVFGEEHFSMGVTLFNLGSLLRNLGRYEESERYYHRAQKIWSSQLGPDHYYVRTAVNNIAQVLYDVGDLDRSEALFLGLIAQERTLLDADDASRAFALNNLGMLYHLKNDFAKALTYLKEAQDLRVAQLGPSHDLVLDGYINLGRLQRSLGNYPLAEEYYQAAIDFGTERYAADHVIVGRAHREVAELWLLRGEPHLALQALRLALPILSEHYPEGFWETAWALSLKGKAHFQLAEYDAAEQALTQAVVYFQQGEDADSRYARDTLEVSVELFSKLGQSDRVREYSAMLKKMPADMTD